MKKTIKPTITIHSLDMDKSTGRAFTKVVKTDITVTEDKEFRKTISLGNNQPRSLFKGDKSYFRKLNNWRRSKAKRKQNQKVSRLTRMFNFLTGK
jgi:hypothetical protein